MNKKLERSYLSAFEDEKIRNKIKTILFKVLKKLENPDYVKKNIDNKNNFVKYLDKEITPWEDTSLACGYPAICVFLGEVLEHYPSDKYDKIAYNYVLKINECLAQGDMLSSSLFEGITGVGFAVTALSKEGTRYKNFIKQINNLIIEYVEELLPIYYERLKSNDLHMSDYDVISGIVGVGRYLLLYKENEKIIDILKKILIYLIEMTKDKNIQGYLVPGWHISSKNQFLDHEKDDFPNGNFNLGVAHGIPGPLSLLSLCLLEGVEVNGQREAIKKIADWLMDFRIKTDNGFFWNFNVSWDEFITGKVKEKYNSRMGWCYGTPGVARIMYLAGKAINNQKYLDISIKSIDNIFKVEKDKWGIYSPTFCHGYAGFLHILNLMYTDTGEKRFKKYIMELIEMIFDKYEEESIFGFYNYELNNKNIDVSMNVGLLEGVSGICLVLLALIEPIKTDWDSVFLLI